MPAHSNRIYTYDDARNALQTCLYNSVTRIRNRTGVCIQLFCIPLKISRDHTLLSFERTVPELNLLPRTDYVSSSVFFFLIQDISHQIYPFRLNILSIAILFYVQTFTTFNYGESTNYKLYFLYYIFITILYIHFLLISSHPMKKKFEISKYLPPLTHYTERVKPAIVCFPVVHTREATAWPRVFRYPSCGSRIGFENVAAVPSTIVHGVIRFKCAISVIRGRVTRSRGKPRRTLHSPSPSPHRCNHGTGRRMPLSLFLSSIFKWRSRGTRRRWWIFLNLDAIDNSHHWRHANRHNLWNGSWLDAEPLLSLLPLSLSLFNEIIDLFTLALLTCD